MDGITRIAAARERRLWQPDERGRAAFEELWMARSPCSTSQRVPPAVAVESQPGVLDPQEGGPKPRAGRRW